MMLKVCGITRREDAEAAQEAGATALGFNFYPASPRYIAPEVAARLGEGLDIRKVGVFVNEAKERVAAIADLARLDTVQLHGDESPAEYPAELKVWKGVRVGEDFDLTPWESVPAEALLLDGPAALLYGGSGKSFDWHIARACRRKIVLAGGLDASNVRQAIEEARPWGVDACSRIESAPGKKDHAKMKAFLNAARAAFA
jgi:phosphoribosylanthranilate isomerase